MAAAARAAEGGAAVLAAAADLGLRQAAKELTLEEALAAVGFISTGLFTNWFNTAAEIQACNTQLGDLKTYMCLARVASTCNWIT